MTKQMETMVPLQNSKENNPPGDRANRTVRWLIAASFAFLMAIGSVAAIPSLTFARQLPPPELPMKPAQSPIDGGLALLAADRQSTRLNSSHVASSYAVFCLTQK